jgi:hypothetical protein
LVVRTVRAQHRPNSREARVTPVTVSKLKSHVFEHKAQAALDYVRLL